FVLLSALPITPNGKLDRSALPAPDMARLEIEGNFVAPRGPIEEAVAGIWAKVLRLERVSIYDSFFELGGHSLLATQVMSRLRKVFQVEFPLRRLFENPTVTDLARVIEEALIDQLQGLTEDEAYCLYNTGDLAHYLTDDQIEFSDRFNQQIKIHGFR